VFLLPKWGSRPRECLFSETYNLKSINFILVNPRLCRGDY
jgi:hypothetical protein